MQSALYIFVPKITFHSWKKKILHICSEELLTADVARCGSRQQGILPVPVYRVQVEGSRDGIEHIAFLLNNRFFTGRVRGFLPCRHDFTQAGFRTASDEKKGERYSVRYYRCEKCGMGIEVDGRNDTVLAGKKKER